MLFVFKGTNQVDPALYDNVTSSLEGMHSLKKIAVFSWSLKYPFVRALLLGALCSKSTTEVYISNNFFGKFTHKSFDVCQHYIPFLL